MKDLKYYNGKSKDVVFQDLLGSLQKSVATWNYFVDWAKVKNNIKVFNTELNILNSLIGSQNIENDFITLCKKYPEIKRALPLLIAVRYEKLKEMPILVNINSLEQILASELFTEKNNDNENLIKFFIESGLKDLFTDKSIKNLVDYTIGVEVGMDTNARKNRTGTIMENIVELDIKRICDANGYEYETQMTVGKISKRWGINVPTDKSERRFDLVVNTPNGLIIFETNFYSGSGSKLKATAGEYMGLNDILKEAGFKFVWITDGAGWLKEHKHLEEAFYKNDYIFNLDMIKKGILNELI